MHSGGASSLEKRASPEKFAWLSGQTLESDEEVSNDIMHWKTCESEKSSTRKSYGEENSLPETVAICEEEDPLDADLRKFLL
jgi:hypothetical protein